MRQLLLPILLLCCIMVVAQTDDSSKEEALLNELLKTPSAETSQPAASTPEAGESLTPAEDASGSIESATTTTSPRASSVVPQNESQESSSERMDEHATTHASSNDAVTPSSIGSSSPDIGEDAPAGEKPRKSDNDRHIVATPGNSSPELSEEARVQKSPDIPNFSHKKHIEDVGAECVQCHQTIFSEPVRGYQSGPSMKEICSQCHNDDVAPSALIAGFSNEKKYIKVNLPLFSHTKHIQHTENCQTCHTDIYGDLKKIKMPPSMSRCTSCHNDHKSNSDCKTCHENVNDLKPKSHTSRWVYRNGHGKDARFDQKECTECHTERSCNACHRGQTTFEVHRPAYKYSHGMDARQRVSNCGYCHDAEYHCAKCHERKQ